jgi:hypothetical protein
MGGQHLDGVGFDITALNLQVPLERASELLN